MSEPKRIAIFGGSFDPPHLGHRKLVEFYLRQFFDTESVLIVPNRLSPFKTTKYFTNQEILKLCELNFSDLDKDRIVITDVELKKDSPSYTYETILEIKKLYTLYSVDLILGEDQFASIPNWKEYEIILREVDRFVVFRRNTESPEPVPIPSRLQGVCFYICENPLWSESSSAWRHWPNEEMIFEPVLKAMKQFSSQRFDSKCIQQWKGILSKEMTITRIEHTLLVSRIALELANAHNYPFPEKMELAGILHDITKQKSKEFHIEIFKKYGFYDYYNYPASAYHAYSAYYYLQEKGLNDEDILCSVKTHTLGSGNMTLAESILYAADYLGSDYAKKDTNYHLWCNHVTENIGFGIYLKSKNTIANLLETNKTIHPLTLEAYNLSISMISQE